jgi:glycosyltransferase involved in cell wall biosynthesis
MRIVILISVVGKVKRGGESTTTGLASYLGRHCHLTVIAGGQFNHPRTINVGFPEVPAYASLFESLPGVVQRRLVRRLHYDPLSVRNILFCKRALPHIRKLAPDLLVFRSVGPWGAKLGRWIRKQSRIPFVTIEGGWYKGERETARYHPNLHIAVNTDVAGYLQRQLPEVDIRYLPNGIRIGDFQPEGQKATVGLPEPVILACGYLGDVKRFHLTIEAVHRMGQASLLILGSGEKARDLEKLGRRLLGQRFDLRAVPHESMAAYYRAASLVTVPSAGESFGMVYLEAMACNKPVVATRDNNRRVLVGQGGLLVDPQRIDDYAQALRYCVENDFGIKPLSQAMSFDWNVVGPKYMAEFEHTVQKAKARKGQSYPVYRRMG